MVHISRPEVSLHEDSIVVEARVNTPKHKDARIWYRLPAGAKTTPEMAADAFFIVGLIIAMGAKEELHLDAPVSPELISSTGTLQEILSLWHPKKLARTEITAEARVAPSTAQGQGVVACFTGGVDSYFTLARNDDTIDSLLYVYGFDVQLSNHELRDATHAHLVEAAETARKQLIEVETNVRVVLNPFAEWGTIAHGPAIASVAHLLGSVAETLLIPASHTYADQYAWGSHPLIDPLWGTQSLQIVHDGAGATRVDKTVAIADNRSAQQHLHVCWQKKAGEYNCGRCEKCLRTKIALHLAGALDKFETFDDALSVDSVRGLSIRNDSDLSFLMENLEFARKTNDKVLSDALRDAVVRYRRSLAKEPGHGNAEPTVASLAERLSHVERSSADFRKEIQRLSNLWPIRAWTRFSRWRRRG